MISPRIIVVGKEFKKIAVEKFSSFWTWVISNQKSEVRDWFAEIHSWVYFSDHMFSV